jgi:hypothetical protein
MVAFREIDLNALGVRLPHNRVGVVMLQPYLRLSAAEPYVGEAQHRPQVLAAIRKTLQVAKLNDHGEGRTHFTVFPELSIPGNQGISLIEETIRANDWPPQTIVMGGIEGLTKAEYAAICAGERSTVDHAVNRPEQVADAQWVNCFITWVKAENGEVHRWIQPKISPAWVEQNVNHHDMFRGGSVFLFKAAFSNGAACRFLGLICFDWVGEHNGQPIVPQALETLSGSTGGESITLHWIFVLQCNPSPSHPTFLARINQVLVQPAFAPNVARGNSCLVFANISGSEKLGKTDLYGRSSVLSSPLAPFLTKDSCRPSFTGKGNLIRAVNTLGACKDSVFRENGPCIHSFSQNIPAYTALDAANKTLSIQVANVHPWRDGIPADPRAPGGPVPCSVKWVNDALDSVRRLPHPDENCELAQRAIELHDENIETLRTAGSLKLQECVEIATCCDPKAYADADYWDALQANALETVLDTLDAFRSGYGEMEFDGSSHATFTVQGNKKMEVVAVRGESHDVCAEHVRKRVTPKVRHGLVIVSRDRDNGPRRQKQQRIFDTAPVGGEQKITEETQPRFISFRELQDSFEGNATSGAMEAWLNGQLAA